MTARSLLLLLSLVLAGPLAASTDCLLVCDRQRLDCDRLPESRLSNVCSQQQSACRDGCEAPPAPAAASPWPAVTPRKLSTCRQRCEESARACNGSNREGSRHRDEVCEAGRLQCHARCVD